MEILRFLLKLSLSVAYFCFRPGELCRLAGGGGRPSMVPEMNALRAHGPNCGGRAARALRAVRRSCFVVRDSSRFIRPWFFATKIGDLTGAPFVGRLVSVTRSPHSRRGVGKGGAAESLGIAR